MQLFNIHITENSILKTPSSPLGINTPNFIGQYCITDDNLVFFAKGLTKNDWIQASGGSSELEQRIADIEQEIAGQRVRGIDIANSLLKKL